MRKAARDIAPLVSESLRERLADGIQTVVTMKLLHLTVTRNYEAPSKQLKRNLSLDEIDYDFLLPSSLSFSLSQSLSLSFSLFLDSKQQDIRLDNKFVDPQ